MLAYRLLAFVLFLAVCTGCSSQPIFADNGNPGQIKVVVYYDENHNSVMDTNESGTQAKLSISQDISCPPTNQEKIIWTLTEVNGIGLFEDLKPGKYCVVISNGFSMTTKMTQEVYVSSDQEHLVRFGVIRP
jgi:hypothetical protein